MEQIIAIAGWKIPSRDIAKEYEKARGRLPHKNETENLKNLANRSNIAVRSAGSRPSRRNEMDFNTAQRLIDFYIKYNRGPEHSDPAYPKSGPETTAIINAAVSAVPQKTNWLTNVVRTSGKAAHSVTHAVSSTTGKVTGLALKVPVIGPGLHGVASMTEAPFKIADEIASGARIDKVAFRTLKQQVQDVHEIAPYAQTVISVVPGVGQGISGAIGASLAMANGRPITEAFETGIKDSIPGGPIAQSVFSVSSAIMKGKPIDEVGISALPISDAQKKALAEGLQVTKRLASGEKVSKIALDEAKRNLSKAVAGLPDTVGHSLKIGIALGNAVRLQTLVKKSSPNLISGLISKASKVVSKDDVLKEGMKVFPNGKSGFLTGVGVTQFQVTPDAVISIRKKLSGENRKAFDAALSLHIGRATHKQPKLPPAGRAGYYMTMGMQGANPEQKTGIMKSVSKAPLVREGAVRAVKKIANNRSSWWVKIKEFLGVA